MYFNLKGEIDVCQMLSTEEKGIDREKFCAQIIENNIDIGDFVLCAEVEKWKKYYNNMHP